MIAFRNVIVHGYDTIDPFVLWDVLRNQVPILLREVEQMMREEEGNGG